MSRVLLRVGDRSKIRRMDDKEGREMPRGSAFNSVAAASERAHLAKLLTSKRRKTTTKPTRQTDILPFCRNFSASYTGIIIAQQKDKSEKRGTCNTVTRKEKMAREVQHSPRSNPFMPPHFCLSL